MAGLWPFSLQQRIGTNGKPLAGAKGYFFARDTLEPITVYADYNMTVTAPNPVTADGYGMFPAVYLDEADAFYRTRITTAGGVILVDLTALPIIGPGTSDGGGGGGGGGGGTTVDSDALWRTGDLKPRFGAGVHSGFVRANGRTIGGPTSGASERANGDTQALFELIWTQAPNSISAVSGGRGLTATADFEAAKTITLPDWRGRDLRGNDSMGTSSSGRLGAVSISSGNPTQVGSTGGTESVTLVETQMPAHLHTGTTSPGGVHSHTVNSAGSRYGESGVDIGTSFFASSGVFSSTAAQTANTSNSGSHEHNFSTAAAGGSQPHSNMPPFALATIYIKL